MLGIDIFNKKTNEETDRKLKFKDDLERIVMRLEIVRSQFDCIDDDDLIDALIYEENGLMARYRQLIKYAKENNINLPVFPECDDF